MLCTEVLATGVPFGAHHEISQTRSVSWREGVSKDARWRNGGGRSRYSLGGSTDDEAA